MIQNILIVNRGLPALKFIISMKEWIIYYSKYKDVQMFGFVTPIDISSKYKYITLLDQAIYTEDNSIYTNISGIIAYCKQYNIHAVFPGWGYLSENETFVKALTDNNILFIGPTYENMCAIGNKISCNNVAEKLGVPVLLWSGENPLHTIEEIEYWCEKIGYPVMLKAGNSGGGKGIRIVQDKTKCYEMWLEILREVVNPMIYATTYIKNASHLEIQILGDGVNAIHLHGRDCTSQRRNQKLIEECPIQKDETTITNIQNYAVQIMKHIGYRGLATVEFIYDQDTKKVYILEVNPRIQVEHIITEQLFDVNLIKLLFLVANGVSISEIKELTNLNYNFNKHILSVRINSENPYEEFRPTLGEITEIDITYNKKSWGYFSISNNSIISEQVDSQFGHILVIGENRTSAIQNMTNLIDGLKIRGTIYNTSSFLKNFINDEVFKNNMHTTKYLNSGTNTQLFNTKYNLDSIIVIGMLYNSIFYNEKKEKECIEKLKQGHNFLLNEINKFQQSVIVFNNAKYDYEYLFEIEKHTNTNTNTKKCLIQFNHKIYMFEFQYTNNTMNIILKNKYLYTIIHSYHDEYQFEVLINQLKYNFIRKIKDNKILNQASGKIIECVFQNGDIVNKGDIYIKIECMKMIMPFKIENSGKIQYFVKSGDNVFSNQVIGEILMDDDDSTSPKNQYQINNEIMKNFDDNYRGNHHLDEIIHKNKRLLNSSIISKQPYVSPEEIAILFSPKSNYNLLSFGNGNGGNENGDEKEPKYGSKGYLIENKYVLLVNDLKKNNGVFTYYEDEYYFNCLRYARENKTPFVFIASNSGAEIKINESLKFVVKPLIDKVTGEFQYFFLDEIDYEKYKSEVISNYCPEHNHYKITCINNPGVVNLDGSALLVSEMAKARKEIQTITFVIDRTVGVGAYLARLSERIVQRKDSSILLTGYQSINKVLGKDLYESNIQLGGYNIMSNNGISHKIVETTIEGIEYIKSLLYPVSEFSYNLKKTETSLTKTVSELIDKNSFIETMENYAKNVITGRCGINYQQYGVIFPTECCVDKFIPCDPADLTSSNKINKMSPNILYPDTSYKIAKTIRDCDIEGLPLLIIADWRGFSGGTRDMYENVLDFGSMIVSELAHYHQKVTIYIPPQGQLRGGSMVVFSKSINKEKITMYASSSACINVLEPSATKELKYKIMDKKKYAGLHNIQDEQLMETLSLRYVELNDCINTDYKILNKYERIVDEIVEPMELKKILV
jgi:biotin carboxylase/acetyl-CoA carboxylase carboxyltransferase component/biotin carboxyl carrier protein